MKVPKNFLLFLSLSISLIGLILIYFASVKIDPKSIAISDITADMEGRKIVTTGYLVDKKEHKDGHLFLTIEENNAKIQVPLFSSFVDNLNKVGITKDDFKINDKISVKGTVTNYKGALEIIPGSLADVKILGD